MCKYCLVTNLIGDDNVSLGVKCKFNKLAYGKFQF